MGSMTMVFQIADPAMPATVKAGNQAECEAGRVNRVIVGRVEARRFMVRPLRTEIGI